MSKFVEFFLGVVVKVAIGGLDWYFKKKKHNDEMRKAYLTFVEKMHEHGLMRVKNRLSSEKQIEKIKEKWKNETDPS